MRNGQKRSGMALICTWWAPRFRSKRQTPLDSITPYVELLSCSKTFKESGFFYKICGSFEYLMAYRLIPLTLPPLPCNFTVQCTVPKKGHYLTAQYII